MQKQQGETKNKIEEEQKNLKKVNEQTIQDLQYKLENLEDEKKDLIEENENLQKDKLDLEKENKKFKKSNTE